MKKIEENCKLMSCGFFVNGECAYKSKGCFMTMYETRVNKMIEKEKEHLKKLGFNGTEKELNKQAEERVAEAFNRVEKDLKQSMYDNMTGIKYEKN